MQPRGLRECGCSLEVGDIAERAEHLPVAEHAHHADRCVVREEAQLTGLEPEHVCEIHDYRGAVGDHDHALLPDRKSTRLNSSHGSISYAVFCLKKKKKKKKTK